MGRLVDTSGLRTFVDHELGSDPVGHHLGRHTDRAARPRRPPCGESSATGRTCPTTGCSAAPSQPPSVRVEAKERELSPVSTRTPRRWQSKRVAISCAPLRSRQTRSTSRPPRRPISTRRMPTSFTPVSTFRRTFLLEMSEVRLARSTLRCGARSKVSARRWWPPPTFAVADQHHPTKRTSATPPSPG